MANPAPNTLAVRYDTERCAYIFTQPDGNSDAWSAEVAEHRLNLMGVKRAQFIIDYVRNYPNKDVKVRTTVTLPSAPVSAAEVRDNRRNIDIA